MLSTFAFVFNLRRYNEMGHLLTTFQTDEPMVGRRRLPLSSPVFKLSVGVTSQAHLLETDGLFTQGS
jgi:hypothetical protein